MGVLQLYNSAGLIERGAGVVIKPLARSNSSEPKTTFGIPGMSAGRC